MPAILDFLHKAKETNTTIAEILECVHAANGLKNRAGSATARECEEIIGAMQSIGKEFRNKVSLVKRELEKMREENEIHLEKHGFDQGFTAKNAHIQGLCRRLGVAIEDFRRVQQGFAAREEERLKSQYAIANPNAKPEELEAASKKEPAVVQAIFVVGKKSAGEILAHAEKRHASIQNMLREIAELRDLSNDFLEFLTTNGTDMDRVHLDVRSSLGQSHSAETVIKDAADRKIRMRKAKKNAAMFLGLLFVLCSFWAFCRLASCITG